MASRSGQTTRRSIGYPIAPGDDFTISEDIQTVAEAADADAIYEQGVTASLPVGTDRPNGTVYAATNGSGVWVNVGTGGGRLFRKFVTEDSSGNASVTGDLAVGDDITADSLTTALGATIGGNAVVGGAVNVAGNATIDGTLSVGGVSLPGAATPNAYRPLFERGCDIGAGTTSGTTRYMSANLTDALGGTSTIWGGGPFSLDQVDYLITGKTAKLRVRARLQTNATAPLSSYTVGLYRVTASGGGADTFTLTTGGSAVIDSTVALGVGAASSLTTNTSIDFDMPTTGHYVLGVTVGTATQAAGALVNVSAVLQLRYV